MKLSDIKANPWIQPHVPEMFKGPVGKAAYPAAGTFIEHTEGGYIKMGIAYEFACLDDPEGLPPAKPGAMPAHWGLRQRIEYRISRIREWVALRIAPWLRE